MRLGKRVAIDYLLYMLTSACVCVTLCMCMYACLLVNCCNFRYYYLAQAVSGFNARSRANSSVDACLRSARLWRETNLLSIIKLLRCLLNIPPKISL